jgi:hypothetical protein
MLALYQLRYGGRRQPSGRVLLGRHSLRGKALLLGRRTVRFGLCYAGLQNRA